MTAPTTRPIESYPRLRFEDRRLAFCGECGAAVYSVCHRPDTCVNGHEDPELLHEGEQAKDGTVPLILPPADVGPSRPTATAKELLAAYDGHLAAMKVEVRKLPANVLEPTMHDSLEHVRHLCTTAQFLPQTARAADLLRVLGFVQGVFWQTGMWLEYEMEEHRRTGEVGEPRSWLKELGDSLRRDIAAKKGKST